MKSSIIAYRAIAAASIALAGGVLATSANADNANQYRLLPAFDKVVLVVEENQQEQTVIGNSATPYTNWLATHGALMTQSWGTEHPSQPNYFDIFAGEDENCFDDNPIPVNPMSGDNLGAELLHHGLSFVGYSENLPYVGDTVDAFGAAPTSAAGTHDYARKHNPWTNWQNDAYYANIGNLGSNYLPSTVNQTLDPFTAICASGNFAALPTVSIVVPNQQHDDHGVSGGASGNQLLADGDTWLQNNLGAYAAWAKTHNSLLIVTFDEDDYTSINQVPTIFYGDHVIFGKFPENGTLSYTSVINGVGQPSGQPIYRMVHGINHWNVLRTIEDIYGLGHAGQSEKVTPITDIFTKQRAK